MFWASSKVFLFLLAIPAARAELGIVSGIGTGKDVPEATSALLKSVVAKNFRDPNSLPLLRSVLQFEILPNSSSFVQSYKILDSGKSKMVNLSASVDLEVVRALLSVTPGQLGEEKGAKALVVVRGAPIPEENLDKNKATPPNPYLGLEAGARERLLRRGFTPVGLSDEEIHEAGEDSVSSPEFLRGLGAKAGARLALGISSKYELFENENSHNKELKLIISANLVDVKSGMMLAKEVATATSPKSRKEQYVIDLQRVLGEEGRDLFHEIFVDAGKRLVKSTDVQDYSVLRVIAPQNAPLLAKFRAALEAVKEVRSVVEFGASRGAFDFSLRPVFTEAALTKLIKGISSEEFEITVQEKTETQGPTLSVKISPKEPAVAPAQEVPNASP